MTRNQRLNIVLGLTFIFCAVAFWIIGRGVLQQDASRNTETSRQAETRKKEVPLSEDSSGQADLTDGPRDAQAASGEAPTSPTSLLPPSQVEGQVFPRRDLDALAFRLQAGEFAVYERMRLEFPEVDWTEIESAHQAFLDKRSEFPLNLNDEQREAYATWLGEVEPVSRALIRLRAESHGLAAGGTENGRGYYIDGFRGGVPVYVVTSNVGAAITTGVNLVRSNLGFDPALGDTVNGTDIYVNVNDHGEIYEHTEFQLPNSGGSRIMIKEVPGYADGERNHMTHVAGTMAAWGYNSSLQGMAPRAWIRSLIQQTTTHISNYGMATPGQTIPVNNPRTGNLQLRSVVGNTSLGTLSTYNRYDSSSAAFDSIMRDRPYYMHFNSTGNSGSGFETLTGGWKIAKNMIGIGNATAVTRDANGAYVSGGVISGSSSRGPTYDGRINPDFVAKGTSVTSTIDTTGSGTYSGTSMASPNSAGSVALLMDYVRQRMPQQYLRSSTYRALLASTADDRGNPGPDYTYGWGVLNVHAAAKILRQQAENPSLRLVLEESLAPSQTWTETYASDGTKPIRVSISWLDPASTNTNAEDRASRLVNDLDVRLTGPGEAEHQPYVMPFVTGQASIPAFDPSLYTAHAVPGDNTTDPVEQVYIAAPAAGIYTVRVTHKGSLLGNQAQPFSVAVSGLTSVFEVAPLDALTAVGPQGGPFDPDGRTYTITNNGTAPLVWSVATNPAASWLTLSSSSGTIPAGSSATMTASFTANANALAGGTYATNLIFSSGGITVSRPVSLQVRPMVGFAWETIPSPRYWKSPFAVNLRAVDSTGATIRSFAGTATLSPIGTGAGTETTEIGTGTGTAAFPLKTASHDARTQTIYLSSELGGAKDITSLALNVATTPGQTLNNFTIRLQHTATSSYNNDNQAQWLNSGWTTVYQGSLTISQTGWMEFPFSSPFSYNGTNNLMVDISFNNNSGSTDGAVQFTTGTNRSITFASNSANDDPLTWSARIPAGTRSTNIPNIRLISPGSLTITPTVTGNFVNGVWAGLVTFEQAVESVYLRASSGGLFGDSNSFAVDAITIPTVTAWPTASAITYGQTVGVSTLTGGSASVPGTFSFTNPSATPEAGTLGVPVVFTPTDSANYGTVDGLVNLVVNKATPTVTSWPTASAIVFGDALSASSLSGGSASVSGSFAFLQPALTPPTGTYNATVRFIPADANNYNIVDGSVSVAVAKQTPTIAAWPTASGIVYGQELSASSLSGGSASVGGSFTFDAPATVLNAGTHDTAVTFTPADSTNYNTVAGSVNVVVAKATPVVTAWPTASAIQYGQVVADSSLDGGSASVPGIFVFSEGGAGFSGSDSFSFVANDGWGNSAPATVSIALAQGSQAESIAEFHADPIMEADAEPASLTSTSTVRGDGRTVVTFTAGSGTWTVPDGVRSLEVLVVGGGGSGAAGGTWNADGGGAGGLTYYSEYPVTRGAEIAVAVGTGGAARTSYGIGNHGTASTFDNLSASGGEGGLSNRGGNSGGLNLNGIITAGGQGATHDGSNGGGGAVTNGTGDHGLNPGGNGYQTAITGTLLYYGGGGGGGYQGVGGLGGGGRGNYLGGGSGPGEAGVDGLGGGGGASRDDPNSGAGGSGVVIVAYIADNYLPVANAQSVTVERNTPKAITLTGSDPDNDPLTFAIVTPPTYGVLSGEPPNVIYTPPTIPDAGTYGSTVIFIPTDSQNYENVSGSVDLPVVQLTDPEVTAWPTASALVYGQALSASTLSGGTASVSGSFSFDSPSIIPNAGSYQATVRFTPSNTLEYRSVTGSVTVEVAKATPSVSVWPTASAIEFGQALSASTLSGGAASVAGSFAFEAPSTVPPTGTYSAAVVFTPTDANNYQAVTGSVSVSVGQIATWITEWPSASGITYGQALSASSLSGGAASVPGSFAFSSPATLLNAGTHDVAVTFTPNDAVNYTSVEGAVSIVVAKATPVITAWPTASDINYGQYLSASALSGGTASVPGAFVFNDAAAEFTGQDSFTFRVSDGTLFSEPATVSLAVNAPLTSPTAHAADAAPSSTTTRGDGYTVVTFTENEVWTVPSGVTSVEVLVVGGGGGGGASITFSNAGGGGGGAGGLIHIPEYPVTSGNDIQVTVGAGGAPGASGNNPGTNGQNSVFGELVALGGGGGSGGNTVGLAGGSGGGSRINSVVGGAGQQPSQPGLSGQYGFGNNGGAVNEGVGASAGGGGGAGVAGSGITGGNGRSVSITGTASTYAGGGGGGGAQGNTPGNGGTGGGGRGANDGIAATAGTPNTGGGGGGGNNDRAGAAGGSGIVIVAYTSTNQAPIAHAQSVTVEPNTPTAITLTGSDPDDNPLSFEILTQPTHGVLTGTGPNVTYTPPPVPEPGNYSVEVLFSPEDTTNYLTVTGSVNVKVLGSSTPYQDWAGQFAGEDLSNLLADNDGDGLNNLQEYAFGLHPAAPSRGMIRHEEGEVSASGTPAISVTKVAGELDCRAVFGRRKDYVAAGLTYTVQFSANLIDWANSGDVPQVVAVGAEVDAVSVPFPAEITTPAGQLLPKFFRVAVSLP